MSVAASIFDYLSTAGSFGGDTVVCVSSERIKVSFLSSPEYYIVVDLEGTCDASGFPRGERETIEIGAVLVDARTLEAVRDFQTFVRPVRHPHLTEYCRTLTSITQGDVDSAPTFSDAFKAFCLMSPTDGVPPIVSWGGYDRRQLKRDCEYHGVQFPFREHIDLSLSFMRHANLGRRISMVKAMDRVGLSANGVIHRALDDAQNLVKLLPWALGLREIPRL